MTQRAHRPTLHSDFAIDSAQPLPWREVRRLVTRRAGATPPPAGYPLVEPGAVTFAWRGEAEGVRLRHFMAHDPDSFPFERQPGSRLWRLRLKGPDRARFEYKLDILRDGHGEWVNDPLNPAQATDPFGANSVCATWGYRAPEWTQPDPDVGGGRIEHFTLQSAAYGERRDMGIYLPQDYSEDARYPLVIVHDGFDYLDHAGLKPILDNLIARGELPPLIAALTHSPDRMVEYVDDPRHANLVADELIPAVEARWSVERGPRGRVLMGASLGAVASLSIAARAPQLFGGVVLKSGSFIFDPRLLETRAELFARISAFIDGLSPEERLLHRAFVCCGRYEGLVGENRRMAAFLRKAGVTTRYVESLDAHHWHNWRDQTRAGLMWCLPRKLPWWPADSINQ